MGGLTSTCRPLQRQAHRNGAPPGNSKPFIAANRVKAKNKTKTRTLCSIGQKDNSASPNRPGSLEDGQRTLTAGGDAEAAAGGDAQHGGNAAGGLGGLAAG